MIQIQTPTAPGKTSLCSNDDINQKLINMDIIICMYIVHVLPPDVFFLWERCFGIPQEPGSHLIEFPGSSGYRPEQLDMLQRIKNVRYEKMKPRRWSLWTTTNGRYLVSIQRGQELTPQTICRRYFCPRLCCLSIRLTLLNKAPRLSIKIDVWILLYDTVFVNLNQLIYK